VFGQDSPFDFDLEYGLAGLHVDPTSRGGPADTLTVGPYPTYSFNATTYLSGYLRYPVPTVLTAVWRVDASRLQVTIFNWSAEPARFRATLDLSLYDLPHARCRCTVRDLVGDVILQSVLPRSPIQIIAGGSDQEIAPSISIPKVPLRQVFILTIESIP
jgi:hypothetical protein